MDSSLSVQTRLSTTLTQWAKSGSTLGLAQCATLAYRAVSLSAKVRLSARRPTRKSPGRAQREVNLEIKLTRAYKKSKRQKEKTH